MTEFTEKPELNNNDNVFAHWLKKHGWNGRYQKCSSDINYYLRDDGKLICTVVYDNKKCTYRVFA